MKDRAIFLECTEKMEDEQKNHTRIRSAVSEGGFAFPERTELFE